MVDLVSDFGVAEPNKTPNKYIIKFKRKHSDLFNIEFNELGKLKRVGSGAFGTVYKTLYKGEMVAAKRIDTAGGTHDTYLYLEREIINLSKLRHPNILRYIGVTHQDLKEIYLITDLVIGSNLEKLSKKIKRNYPVIISICTKIAFGMRYMNSHKMLHRDIKLANILVSSDYSIVKLCDFGLSLIQNEEISAPVFQRKMTLVGTKNFMAPEVKSGKTTYSSDVYSFGVLLAMLLGYPKNQYKKEFNRSLFNKKKDKNAPDDLIALVTMCVREDSTKRPTFSKIASGLITLYSQLYPNEEPLIDEEANVTVDIAPSISPSITKKRNRKRQLHRSRSVENMKEGLVQSTSTPTAVRRQRAFVTLNKPDFSSTT